MAKIRIIGGTPLSGIIPISGAKNAALPLMCASLLSAEPLTLTNTPYLADIITMARLLQQHGVSLRMLDAKMSSTNPLERKPEHYYPGGYTLELNGASIHNLRAPYEMVKTMRASVLVLGPLLARFGAAEVSLPGGCAIGTRPVDLHLKALEEMGATIELRDGYVIAAAKDGLKGADILFPKVSVGATSNILMAATLADGITRIRNAAREPEIADLAQCLQAMGANISGVGTSTLEVKGVGSLHAATHRVLPDRIETGSYIAAVALAGGEVSLRNADLTHLEAVVNAMRQAGVMVEEQDGAVCIRSSGKLKGVDVMTEPHPGFPTDMQAQFMAMMCLADGASMISETIFENRFMHVPELARMGANITIHGGAALVRGVKALRGAQVMATDLRASMSLVIAALAAEGETVIDRIYHLDRGYEALEEKLQRCGANISRIHY